MKEGIYISISVIIIIQSNVMSVRIYNFNGNVRDVSISVAKDTVKNEILAYSHVYFKLGYENPLNLMTYIPNNGDIIFELPYPDDCFWDFHQEKWLSR